LLAPVTSDNFQTAAIVVDSKRAVIPDSGKALVATIARTQEQSIAHFGGVALRAFDEVEVELTNERLLAERLPYTENAVLTHAEAVRVANLRHTAGTMDFLSVLQLEEGQIPESSRSHQAT
jgi:outer membrane protein TolC